MIERVAWAYAASRNARFTPMTSPDERPEVTVAGVAVSVYVDSEGTFQVSVHCDTGEVAPQLISPDGQTVGPIRITVDGNEVWSDARS